MFLTRLIYVSRRNPDMPTDLERLLDSARRRNREAELTGALVCDRKYFVQVLEGSRVAVSETYHRICADPRHLEIEVVSCVGIAERAFWAWSMGYCGDTAKNREAVLRFSRSDRLEPREMSADSLLAWIRALEMA